MDTKQLIQKYMCNDVILDKEDLLSELETWEKVEYRAKKLLLIDSITENLWKLSDVMLNEYANDIAIDLDFE